MDSWGSDRSQARLLPTHAQNLAKVSDVFSKLFRQHDKCCNEEKTKVLMEARGCVTCSSLGKKWRTHHIKASGWFKPGRKIWILTGKSGGSHLNQRPRVRQVQGRRVGQVHPLGWSAGSEGQVLTDVPRPHSRESGRKLRTWILFSDWTSACGIEHVSVCKQYPVYISSLGIHNGPTRGAFIVLHFYK